MRLRKPSPATVIALTALVVALGGVAYATIPDSSGTIHACHLKSNGSLRAVESADQCRNNEEAIDWNQRGRSGATGPAGPPGPPGPPGETDVEAFYSEVKAEESTSSPAFGDLTTPGPRIEVDVPPRSLVSFYMSAEVKSDNFGALVRISEATDLPVNREPLDDVLAWANTGGAFVTFPSPSSLRFHVGPYPATAGTRTYELKYRTQGPGGTSTFKNRRLWVQVVSATEP